MQQTAKVMECMRPTCLRDKAAITWGGLCPKPSIPYPPVSYWTSPAEFKIHGPWPKAGMKGLTASSL